LEKGVPRNAIDAAPTPEANVLKLRAGRIDMWAYEESVAKWILKNHNIDPSQYETVFTLSQGELYFAFNKQTPDSVLAKLQNALDQIKTDGTFQSILAKYLK
jgi:ABC-type amino acid transport substrate-binding protein